MIDPHVEELALAIDAIARRSSDAADLVAAIRRAYPDEPIVTLRRAIYYAVTDPDRTDEVLTLRLFDVAFAIMSEVCLQAA
ncbi:hypothetical protein C3941_02250 [Kaistia algarum]|uniref:hypothetical protein n=1 Tax=Kaistia algarum TaxID=2083279 RepID=UPI000CE89893|nr:hypothetical protein [Kaistia algarum]MCX5512961.1 hypothetical protein [Kaistia algarum]PPE81551.1 hypothetical protein C3941_02250 [Kaistia algarum]